MEKQKTDLIRYCVHPETVLDIESLALLVEAVDKQLPDPLRNREYFVSYRNLAEKFVRNGLIPHAILADGKLVAAAVLYVDNLSYHRAYETYIGVLSEFSGMGIASQLMGIEIDYCRKSGIDGIMTNCHPVNVAKKTLNIKMGFREVTQHEDVQAMENMNPKWVGKSFYVLDF